MPNSDSDATTESEATLTARAATDSEALATLYRGHVDRIYAFIASRVCSRAEAEDITSDVWLRVFQKIDSFQFRGEGSFGAWVFAITRNMLHDYYRHTNRVPLMQSFDTESEEESIVVEADAPNDFHREMESRVLREIVRSLPARQGECIALRYFGGLRNREIAQVLNISEKTVASNLLRGLTAIRKKLANDAVLRRKLSFIDVNSPSCP